MGGRNLLLFSRVQTLNKKGYVRFLHEEETRLQPSILKTETLSLKERK